MAVKFNVLMPELSVVDLERSKYFYVEILGFCLEYERAEDRLACVSLGEAQLLLEEINGHWATGELAYPFGRGVNFQIAAPDVAKLGQALKSNGIPLFREVYEAAYRENDTVHRMRELLVQDPDGYLLRFAQAL